MIQWSSSGNPNSDLSITWDRQGGDRVVVVVDDYVSEMKDKPGLWGVSARSHGLYTLYEAVRLIDQFRGIGFFELVSSNDPLFDLHPVNNAFEWIRKIADEQTTIYVLFDAYWGDGDFAGRIAFEKFKVQFETRKYRAKCGFLSQAGAGTLDDLRKQYPEIFETGDVPIFGKYDIMTYWLEQESKPPIHRIQPKLRQFFDLTMIEPTAASWNVSMWKSVRRAALRAVWETGRKIKDNHPFCAHHLDHGGEGCWSSNRVGTAIEALTQAICAEAPEAREFPQFAWKRDLKNVQAWERPPIRGMAQFDSSAYDLSTAVFLISEDIRRRADVANAVDVNPIVTYQSTLNDGTAPSELYHDYLWFNVSCLGKGLMTLAKAFAHEIQKHNRDNDRVASVGTCLRGDLAINFEERKMGLDVTIKQDRVLWTDESERGRPCLQRRTLALIPHADASGQLKEAYEWFVKAGANLLLNTEGGLILRFEPHIYTDSMRPYWEVEVPM